MNIEECMAYIHQTLWLGSKPGLARTRRLLDALGNPERRLKFVHVVGTNGKGSVSSMLSLILKESGYKVGTFVSPYIVRFNERIQIGGEPISDEDLCRTLEKIRPFADAETDDPPTEFERITALGFLYFAEKGCDIVVLEAGMGGAMDSTNVIDCPVVSVFTAIGMDHKDQLGESVSEIARTKAGILKKGTVAVFNGEEAKARPVIEEICASMEIPLVIPNRADIRIYQSGLSGSYFDYGALKVLHVGLSGLHQVENAVTAIEAARALNRSGFPIPEGAIRKGLSQVRWPARFEVLSKEPLVIFDGAHNKNGVTRLCENIQTYFPGKKLVMLMGVMADKDYGEMLDLLMPLCKRFYGFTPANPRALSAKALCEEARMRGVPAMVSDLETIVRELAPDEVLLIAGSLYMYGEIAGKIDCIFRANRV